MNIMGLSQLRYRGGSMMNIMGLSQLRYRGGSMMDIMGLSQLRYWRGSMMDIMPDLTFLNIHNSFTNERRISVYLDKHNRMSLNIKDYFVKQISHLSKAVVIMLIGEGYGCLVTRRTKHFGLRFGLFLQL